MTKNSSPLISIIIPTYNSEEYIGSCLKSLKEQPYKNIEVIIVDQSSTDETQSIVKKTKAKLIIFPKPAFYTPPTASRNKGAKAAKGEILIHLDSDMRVSKELISEIATKLDKKSEYGALIIHEEDIARGYWSKCKAFERKCYWGNDSIESARAVKRSIFEKVKGYDENLSSGEDFDIHKRYKKYCKIGFCEHVVYHNLDKLSFMRTISKKYNYGKTAGRYFKKHDTSGQSILKEQMRCYYKNWPKICANPTVGIGSLFLKFSEFTAGGIGLLIKKS